MNLDDLRTLLEQIQRQERSVDSALEALRHLPYEDLDFARLDHHRKLRTGVAEVVYGPGKTASQTLEIVRRMLSARGQALVSRPTPEAVEAVQSEFAQSRYYETARLLAVGNFPQPAETPFAVVVSAGTSDQPVAEEAAVTLELHGVRAVRIYDVGVAGVHRLLDHLETLWQARVVIAVAGMEGALATVLGGLVSAPLIAVPTSVGYGASFQGVAALLAMLNSCAPGVSVVNIDNGFGAGVCATLILRTKTCK